MEKIISLIALILTFSTTAFAEQKPITVKAQFFLCNELVVNNCRGTSAYGEGFGLIVFKDSSKKRFAVRPGGKDVISASMMGGKLQAIEVIEKRDQKYKAFIYTKEFTVTGVFGKDPIEGKRNVFYVWSID